MIERERDEALREELYRKIETVIARFTPNGIATFGLTPSHRFAERATPVELLAMLTEELWNNYCFKNVRPQFDAIQPAQEDLAVQYAAEIAAKAKQGVYTDPQRLLEIAEELYFAEVNQQNTITSYPVSTNLVHTETKVRRTIQAVRSTGYTWSYTAYGKICPNGKENSFNSEDSNDPFFEIGWEIA